MMPANLYRVGIVVLSVGILLFVNPLTQAQSKRGDITGDGIIDGRDALKIMRIVEGFDPPQGESTSAGDVFPFPGTDGRFIGDGQLTEEDAYTILLQTVGLLSESDLNGTFSESAPIIYDFEPYGAEVGEQVTIVGENFVTSHPNDNQVLFGDVAAVIHDVTQGVIITEVPEGASTGLIQVKTPGGVATAPADFRVTVKKKGTLRLASQDDVTKYILSGHYGLDAPNADGTFLFPVIDHGVTLVQATSLGDDPVVYFAVDVSYRNSGETEVRSPFPLVIDTLSTAKSLLFMSPFIATRDPEKAEFILTKMDTLVETHALAEVLAKQFSQNKFDLEDPEFNQAFEAALTALTNQMPEAMTFSLPPRQNQQAKILSANRSPYTGLNDSVARPFQDDLDQTPMLEIQSSNNPQGHPVTLYRLDSNYIETQYNAEKDRIELSLDKNYSPVDWIVTMYQMKPEAFPRGIQESFIDMLKRHFTTKDYTDFKITTVQPGNPWTAKIDVLYTVVDTGIKSVVGTFSDPGNGLKFKVDDPGVYMIRSFSGAVVDKGHHPYDFLSLAGIPDGRTKFIEAYALNLGIAMVDLFDFATKSSQRWVRTALKKARKNFTRKASQILGESDFSNGMDYVTIKKLIVQGGLEFGIALLTAAVGEGVNDYSQKQQDAIQKKIEESEQAVQKSLNKGKELKKLSHLKALSKAFAILGVLDKVSSLGRIIERLNAMYGNLTTLDAFPPASPLETVLVVVGKPFDPIIDSFQPLEGGEGTEVTITGKKFSPDANKNAVYFGGKKAKMISASGGTQLVVRVPPGLNDFSEVDIKVETPASEAIAKRKFKVIQKPVIDKIEPSLTYMPGIDDEDNPFRNQESTITIHGFNLMLDSMTTTVTIGGIKAPIKFSSKESLTVTVPKLEKAGGQDVKVSLGNAFRVSNFYSIWVLEKPRIDSVNPTSAAAGQYVTIKGDNLHPEKLKLFVGTWADRLEIISFDYHKAKSIAWVPEGESIIFQVPTLDRKYQNDNGTFDVILWNPAGRDTKEITLKPGIKIAYLKPLAKGYWIPVTADTGGGQDGKITLDEVNGFLNNKSGYNLLEWDDKNAEWIHYRFERRDQLLGKDEYGKEIWSYKWVDSRIEKKELDFQGPSDHETIKHYYVDTDRNGNVTDKYFVRNEDLDATPEQLEEADLIAALSSDLKGTKYDAKAHRDEVHIQGGLTINGEFFELPPQDHFIMESGSKLVLTNQYGEFAGFKANSGSVLDLQQVVCNRPIQLMGTKAAIIHGRFTGTSEAVLLDQAFGASITGVEISGSAKHGIIVRGGGGHTLQATIHDVGEDGIHIESSFSNTVSGQFWNCVGNAVSLLQSHGNIVGLTSYPFSVKQCGYGIFSKDNSGLSGSSIGIQDNTKGGILLQKSDGSSLSDMTIFNNGGPGITLNQSKLNSIEYSTLFDNKGTGIVIEESFKNQISETHLYGNLGGLILSGSQTTHNIITASEIGLGEDNGGEGTVKLTHGVGIHLSDGASLNEIHETLVYGCTSHGVEIEGGDTGLNTIRGCRIGNPDLAYLGYFQPSYTPGNQGDGIRIHNGSSSNTIDQCFVGLNQGNGITMVGDTAGFNTIRLTFIGTQEIDYTDTPSKVARVPNQGWGIEILDNSVGNLIDRCVLGVNMKGGIHAQNLEGEFEDGSKLLRILGTSIGWSYFPSHLGSASPFPLTFSYDEAKGTGIAFDNVSNSLIKECDIAKHDIGMTIVGSDSTGNEIQDMEIEETRSNGLLVRGSNKHAFMHTLVSHAKADGIVFDHVSDITFEGQLGSAQNCQGHGIVLQNSKNVTIKQMQVGPSNQKDGVHITQSDNIQLVDTRSIENQGHGFYVGPGSTRVTFNRGEASENQGNGFLFDQANGVLMVGTAPREGLWLFGNTGTGILVNNSKNIQIGKAGFGVNASTWGARPVVITGPQTENISIYSSILAGSNQPGALKIEAGKKITIGGTGADEGNSIELNSDIGILVEGGEDIVIAGNNIGEPKQWETGKREGGNTHGIVLQNKVKDVVIRKNLINANAENGIYIRQGANHNQIIQNWITGNGGAGILVEGSESLHNTLSANTFAFNLKKAIDLVQGGNNEIEAPAVTRTNFRRNSVTGYVKAPDGSYVEVFRHNYPVVVGSAFRGRGSVSKGAFSVDMQVMPGEKLTALVIHPDGNTSELKLADIKFMGHESSVGESYVYQVNFNNQSDIYLKDKNHNLPSRLTDNPANDTQPILNPQADRVLFVSDRSGNQDIWSMKLDGSDLKQETDSSANEHSPALSPDGSSLLYVSDQDGNEELYLKRIKAPSSFGEGVLLSNIPESFTRNFWGMMDEEVGTDFHVEKPGTIDKIRIYIDDVLSPVEMGWKVRAWADTEPGEVLAEGTITPTEIGWYTVDIDNIENVTDFVVTVLFLGWDGPPIGAAEEGDTTRFWYNNEFIGWHNQRDLTLAIQAIMTEDGGSSGPPKSDIVRLTENTFTDRDPAWSPDGSKIVFSSNRSNNFDLWTMNPDGSNPQALTQNSADDIQPAWNPTKEVIAFVSNRSGKDVLYLLDLNTLETTVHEDQFESQIHPAWTADGNTLYYSALQDAEYELYVMALGTDKSSRVTFTLGNALHPNIAQVPLVIPPEEAQNQSQAVQEPALVVDSVTVDEGNEVIVPIRLTHVSQLGNIAFNLSFDESVLKLVSLKPGVEGAQGIYAHNPSLLPSWLDFLRYNWVKASGLEGEGVLLNLVFEIREGAENGDYPITVENLFAYDTQLQSYTLASSPGIITLSGQPTGVPTWMLH